MNLTEVRVVRLFLTEAEGRLDKLLELLHDREMVRGVTVYRGVAGYGHTRHMHEARWPELASDLPLTVEFFDRPDVVERVLEELSDFVETGHCVTWTAQANLESS